LYQKGEAPPEGARLAAWKESYGAMNTYQNWATLDVVREIAHEVKSTPAAVSLAYLLAQPECSSIIIGARSLDQLNDNLAAVSVTLSPEQVRRLEQVSRPRFGYPYDFIGSREPW
jgi:aryl-alcohol dehydrogenase-like predicted oxidoreductase